MKLGGEDFGLVYGQNDNYSRVSPELQAYSDAKLRAAEKREQERLEKPFFIEKIINKLKCKFNCR